MTALDRAAETLASLAGWRRAAAAVACGLLAALAMAPFYLLPLYAVAISAFVLLLDGAARSGRPLRAAFATGWCFGFGFHLLGLYWMAFSFFVQADQFAWMAPFAVTGMPAFLGLFMGGAAALAARFRRRGPARIVTFVAAFMLFEYLRGHILTGLPWNLPGQALAGTAAGAQGAAYVGVYGLSVAALLLAAAPAAFVGMKGGVARGALATIAGAALLFAFGAGRLALNPPRDAPDAFVRIVQPNIPQREKIDGSLWWRNFDRTLTMSSGPGPDQGALFVLWPENAAPVIAEAPEALAEISARLPSNSLLLAGAVRREPPATADAAYFNSIAMIAPREGTAAVVGNYDKHHLVPFGEYLPLQGFLRAVGLAQLAPYEDGFTPGAGPATFELGETLPAFSALICYEAIFPGRIYPAGARPKWIATVTNDAWFGDTSGPRQHLDQARLRSIETGLPMARAANTGVSALIDGAGRFRGRLKLYSAGVIDAPLPAALPPTLYSRVGDTGFWVIWLVCAVAGLIRPRKSGASSG